MLNKEFLKDSLIYHQNLRNVLDTKASIFIGVSGLIFMLGIGRVKEIAFLIIIFASLTSLFLNLLVVFTPFRRDIRGKFSLLGWWGYTDNKFEEFKEKLEKVSTNDEKLLEEYAKEIYNLSKYSLGRKARLLNWSSFILTTGLVLGLGTFLLNL